MVRPIKRRQAEPVIAQKLWSSIRYIRAQKQIPNNERVHRYMMRECDMTDDEIETQLQFAVTDELVSAYMTVGFKGARVGVEQEGYRIPDLDTDFLQEKGSHDWYCFDCHSPGEVLECSGCWRVYHPQCIEEPWTTTTDFLCTICLSGKKKPRIKRKELNKLLRYTVARLKDKTRELHRFGGVSENDDLMIQRFVFKYIDLNEMEAKVGASEYCYLGEFFNDARLLLHNTFICYGDAGAMADLAKIMIRDCKYDLDEIQQCKDCYYNSNAKPKDWFCQPCDPPHELVYAKQKGFTFWPAKVIKVTQEGYDVRFFGGWHQRAIIAESNIRPITLNVKQLSGKRTAGSARATEELHLHQELLVRAAKRRDKEPEADEEPEQAPCEEKMEQEQAPVPESPVVPPPPEPRIRHKKFRKRQKLEEKEENGAEVISSSILLPEKSTPTPEDTNMVTSSQDNILSPRIISTTDTGVQTSRKLLHGRHLHKFCQTDTIATPLPATPVSAACDCDTKYTKIFGDFKERLANDHRKDKERTLKDLEDRLRKDFEEDKQAAVGRAVANVQRETERVRRQTEERCREQYMEEMRKLSAKHKADISAAKKKQWCYNCEEEAMYHCCWNTSYCSIKCQQEHWHREHKRMCRRKRT
ncbi:hypothetical protein NP493_1242g00007 [Ridgeia piscesae]|uniref:Zinc finger MYND domain-containing protein 11 n=1 Tax=Ridgeia piscesae TaxID=27915 RepID=A0AAD9KBK8_RIDPI|nr:hypothetical protein NP493_1242g00007 [Ridgeia piscesae]